MSGANVFVDRVKQSLAKYERDLQLDTYPLLNTVHEKTKQPRIYVVIAVGALVATVLIQLLGLSFISNLFAFVPIYASFKALRSETKEDDEMWLTYWVVYGSLGLFESFFDVVFFWMPFYYLAKIAFVVWAYSPQTRGAQIVYSRFLGPLFGTIENEVNNMEETINRKRAM